MAESSQSANRAIRKNKTAIECLKTSHLSGFISWRDLIVKLFITNVFFKNIGNDYSLITKKITVNYAPTTNQINTY